jgi:hypothetical protein
MKNLKHKDSGQEIQVHEVDARGLINSGEYVDRGTVPVSTPHRVTTVAELAGVRSKAEADALARVSELEAVLVVKNDRIKELEAQVSEFITQAALKIGEPAPFDFATCEDLEAMKAYATANGITFHHAAGIPKLREAIQSFLEAK